MSEDHDQTCDIMDSTDHNPLKIYIVDAKLDDCIAYELRSIVEASDSLFDKHGHPISLQLCAQVEDAEVVVTAVRMKQRLERHISWNLAVCLTSRRHRSERDLSCQKSKAIVTPDWLRDSIIQRQLLPCGDYIAIPQLHDTTVENCPNDDCDDINTDSINISTSIESSKMLCYNARLCCQRSTPLVCPNEHLVQQLAVLRLHRELEGFEINALSYERAIAVRILPFACRQQMRFRSLKVCLDYLPCYPSNYHQRILTKSTTVTFSKKSSTSRMLVKKWLPR